MRVTLYTTIAAAASTLLLFPPPEASAQVDQFGIFALIDQQEGDISINGFPYHDVKLGDGGSRTEIITRFLKQGENEIVVSTNDVTDPENPEAKLRGVTRFRLEKRPAGATDPITLFQLHRECVSATDETGGRIETYVLTTPGGTGFNFENESRLSTSKSALALDLDVQSSTYSHRAGSAKNTASIRISLPDAPLPDLPWLQAGAALDAAGEAEIRQLLEDVHDAFVANDADAIVALLPAKSARLAAADGLTDLGGAALLRDFYNQHVFTIIDLEFEALDLGQIMISPVDGLNLVEVTTSAGEAPIRAGGSEATFAMKMFLSHVDNSWQIVE